MAEPLSISASIIGVATAAIKSAQVLMSTIDNLREVPASIQNIRSDLEVLTPVLSRAVETAQSSNATLREEIVNVVKNCERACSTFQIQLDRWTRHSKGDKTFWLDRWKVAMFGQDRIQALRTQLSDCKSTLNVTMSTANYIAQARDQEDAEDKQLILQPQETLLRRQVDRVERDQATIQNNLQQVSVTVNNQTVNNHSDSEAEASRQELINEMQQQKASNEALRKVLEESVTELQHERIGHYIKNTKATNESQAYAGFVNTDGVGFKGTLNIEDTIADSKSFAAAGVVHNVTLGSLSSLP